MDECDSADTQIQQELSRNLSKRKHELKAVGFCLNCDDVVHSGVVFCSGDCREDFERVESAHRRNGY
jgi:hypothetical protein